jgi:hypothetical protein
LNWFSYTIPLCTPRPLQPPLRSTATGAVTVRDTGKCKGTILRGILQKGRSSSSGSKSVQMAVAAAVAFVRRAWRAVWEYFFPAVAAVPAVPSTTTVPSTKTVPSTTTVQSTATTALDVFVSETANVSGAARPCADDGSAETADGAGKSGNSDGCGVTGTANCRDFSKGLSLYAWEYHYFRDPPFR